MIHDFVVNIPVVIHGFTESFFSMF